MVDQPISSKLSFLQASQWVWRVLELYTMADHKALSCMLRAAEGLNLEKEDVLISGAEFILGARDIWAFQSEAFHARCELLLQKWRLLPGRAAKPRHPMGGLKPKDFHTKVTDMSTWLASVDQQPHTAPWHHQAALHLVGRGFVCPQHLEGLQAADVQKFTSDPKVQSLLKRSLHAANTAGRSHRKRLASQMQDDRPCMLSAADAADLLKGADNAPSTPSIDACHLTGPQAVMRTLSKGPRSEALQCLKDRADALKLSSQQGSGPSVASGLRAWHAFAVTFLDYSHQETLPPKCAADVLKFVALFASAGTATNYVGYVAWACKFHALSLTWRTDEINLALQGLKKAEQKGKERIFADAPKLTTEIMCQLLELCDNIPGFETDGDLYLLAWQFLLRVQSEAVPLERGEANEHSQLPHARHSAVWIDSSFVCHLRLRRRKHMPTGSAMSRPCACQGALPDKLCLSHRLNFRMSNLKPGQKLFPFSPVHYLKRFRNLLELLQVPGASQFGFKTFRAGKATALAKSGCPVHVIMQMGQWRSAALLKYVSPDALDEGVFWQEVVCEDDS